jgi:hypothetical protein
MPICQKGEFLKLNSTLSIQFLYLDKMIYFMVINCKCIAYQININAPFKNLK